MTTKDEQDKSYCEGCVNCLKKGNLYHDIVELECEKGYNIFKDELGTIRYFPFNSTGCDKFDSGSHKGKDIEIFKDVMMTNRNVKRRIKAFDFYENEWRA